MLGTNLLDEAGILLIVDMRSKRDLLDRTPPGDIAPFERLDMIRLSQYCLTNQLAIAGQCGMFL